MTSETLWPLTYDNLVEGPMGSRRDDPSLASVINSIQHVIGLEGHYNFGSGGGGGGGNSSILSYDFHYNTTLLGHTLAQGLPFYTPNVGDVLPNFIVVVKTPFDGYTPQFDIGFLDTPGAGFIGSTSGLVPIDMTVAEAGIANNVEAMNSPQTTSWQAMLVDRSLAFPPALRPELIMNNGGGQKLSIVVSQDGTNVTPVAAFILAQTAVTYPISIQTGVNDKFQFSNSTFAGAGQAPQESFQIAPSGGGGYDVSHFVGAIAAAQGSVSNEPFSNYVTVTDNGANKLLFTMNQTGRVNNGNSVRAGAHDALGPMGFNDPSLFEGGAGGDCASTQGEALLLLSFSTPTPIVP